ncbi:MAG TPA: ABC transporter permease [Vicinamibacterales bacterium]|nr:ABC transporter permease [Vicinamibacterales bacterium]
MSIRALWQWLRSLWQRDTLDVGLDEEIRFHVDQQTAKNVAAGMSPGDARRQALVRFGGVEQTKDATRDQFRSLSLEHLVRDFRFSRRALLRAPGFTTVAVGTLALGIGATTAMFSVVNGVLLRPLPYPDQDRLVELVHEAPGIGVSTLKGSPAVYFGYRDYGHVFDAVGLWDWDASPVTVTGQGEPESVPSLAVTHEVLPMLGGNPSLGRTFNVGDDVPGAAPTAMISHAYAQRRFGAAGPIGRTLVVDGMPRRIIGVLPQAFRFFDYAADIYYPLQPTRAGARFPSGDGRGIARLKPGVTLAQADADVTRIVPLISQEFGGGRQTAERAQFRPKLQWLRTSVIGDLGSTLWLLLGTIALLMLIACANVANLVMVRAHSRQPELVLRAALGAGWGAIARVVFTESALIGAAGGLLGVVVAYLCLPLIVSLGQNDLPGVMAIRIDLRVLLAAVACALLGTVMFSFAPVIQLALPRLRLAAAMHGTGYSAIGTREANRARHVLVVGQVAIALVLLIGSGLMVRTFYQMRHVDPGFTEPDTVLTFQLTLPDDGSRKTGAALDAARDRIVQVHHAIRDRLAAIPGVQTAGFASGNDPLPLDGDGRQFTLVPYFDGRQPPDGTVRVWEQQRISPGFFEAMGTPIVAGRALDWNDVHQRRPVMLVSESVARHEWGSAAAALGHRVSPGGDPGLEIVGVIKDVHHDGVHHPVTDVTAVAALGLANATYVVRSPRVGDGEFMRQVREAVWSVEPNVSLARVQTLGDLYRHSMARTSMTLLLLLVTGALALCLGLIGIYGVVSYAVSQRQREIGVRLALGAGVRDVRRMFVRHALTLVVAGVVLGLMAAVTLTRLMTSQLFGVTPLDPLTHAAVALGMGASAALASYVSARRATSIDPVTVLRE